MENNKNFEKFQELYSDFKEVLTKMNEDVKTEKKTFRTFKVRGADQSVNRNNRSLIIDWINIDDYLKNPVIFINHQSFDVQKIVWRATKVIKDLKKKEIVFEWQFADTKLGNMIADLYEDWFLKTVSLWYNVTERDDLDPRICTKVDLFECSFVAIPANTNAEKMDKISEDKMNELIEAWIITKEDDNLAEVEEINEEKTDKIDEKQELKEGDNIIYRRIFSDWDIYPNYNSNPLLSNIVKIYPEWKELFYFNETVLSKKGDRLVLLQDYIQNKDKKGVYLTVYTHIRNESQLLIELELDSLTNLDNISNFSNPEEDKTVEKEKKVENKTKNDILTSKEDILDLFNLSLNKISL